MRVFEGVSANQVWQEAANVLQSQRQARQSSRAGDTYEIIPACFVIKDPRQRWVISREPALSVAFALVELVGIINGRRDSAYLNYFNPVLLRYAGKGATFYGAYGYRLRQNFHVDQVKRAAEVLASAPDSRQVVLQIWDAQLDLPASDGKARSDDIPCNVCSMLKVRDRRLHWTQVMRSNDLFRGSPYNFVQFTTLQEVVSGWLNLDVGEYTHLSDSLHIYVRDEERTFAYSKQPTPPNTDSLALPYEESQRCWSALNECVDELAKPGTPREIESIAAVRDMPGAYLNVLRIIAADAARRIGDFDLARELGGKCDNAALTLCWERWYARRCHRATRPASL
jgi:thymidylate synthase